MSASLSKWIKLNVGGQYFQTTLTTLLSCPDSLLAKMFDPESGLEPAYSEDGVYFLDTNPKYFSVILDWLRYKEVMADSDINLSNVAKAAKFFGLPELVVALENKILEKKLQKTGAVVIVGANYNGPRNAVNKEVGNYMGYYFKETDIAYRQAGGVAYLYQARDGVWHVNNKMDGKEEYGLRNTTAKQAKILPYMDWEYRHGLIGNNEWRTCYDLQIVVPEELKLCNLITLSSTGSEDRDSYEEFLGKYERISGNWLNGWPVFRNQEGNYLQVPAEISSWNASDIRNEQLQHMDISSAGVTSCPANNKGWTVTIPVFINEVQEEDKKMKLKVTCDVHGNSSQ